jgi:hypothetical protein
MKKAICSFVIQVFVMSLFVFMGCSSKPNAEQLQALEDKVWRIAEEKRVSCNPSLTRKKSNCKMSKTSLH